MSSESDPEAPPLTPADIAARWTVQRHLAQSSGLSFCRQFSNAVDRSLERTLSADPDSEGGFCVIALGGYGRRELSPHSDADLVVLSKEPNLDRVEELLRPFFGEIEAAGVRPSVGHRSLDDTVALCHQDLKTAVALLDTRLLGGSPELYDLLARRLQEEVFDPRAEQIVRFLRAETRLRRERLRSHWYLLEPNLKLSEGGLRDLHAVRWIRQILRRRGLGAGAHSPPGLEEAHAFTLWLRNSLHALARWHQDQLTFEHQDGLIRALAELDKAHFRFARPEDLMRAYYLSARHTAYALRTWLARGEERLGKAGGHGPRSQAVSGVPGVRLVAGRLALEDSLPDREIPVVALRLFRHLCRVGLPLHHTVYERLAALPEGPDPGVLDRAEGREALLDLIVSPGRRSDALEQCHDVGLLCRVLPELEPLRGAFQRNIYHLYTVDVHTLRAITAIKRIRAGELPEAGLAARVLGDGYANDPVVFVALLLHDIEKATGGDQDHAAQLVERALARLGIEGEDADEIRFLVEHHLRLGLAAQTLDTSDEGALLGLAREMGSLRRLDRLYLVTQGDMRAVNPEMISAWKFHLLDTLFLRLRRMIEEGLDLWRDPEDVVERRIAAVVRRLVGHLPNPTHPEARRVRAHFERLPTRYAHIAMEEEVPEHMRLLERVRPQAPLALASRKVAHASNAPGQRLYEVTIAGLDQPRLLSSITGACAHLGLDIRQAHAFSTLDNLALDTFTVEGDLSRAERTDSLRQAIERALSDPDAFGQTFLAGRALGMARRGPTEKARVRLDDTSRGRHLSVEVYAADRLGLLHDLTRALAAMDLDIHLARVSTEGPMARDTFLVSELDGSRPLRGPRTDGIRRALAELVRPRRRGS